jgi:hypothetical protein
MHHGVHSQLDLKGYCEYVDINYVQLLSRWLSLSPPMERLLQIFPVIKSFISHLIHQ